MKAVLLASDKLSADTVKDITKILFENKQELQYALPVDISLDEKSAVEGITIPFIRELWHIMRNVVWMQQN